MKHIKNVMLIDAAALLAAAVLLPAALHAQPVSLQGQPAPAARQLGVVERSSTRGLNLGLHLNGSALEYEEYQGTESGGGGGVRLGYGFADAFTLYSQVDFANMESSDGLEAYRLAQLDIGGRFTFRGRTASWRPYLDVAVSGRAAETEYLGSPLVMSGGAFTLGGGLQWFFSRRAALDMGLKGSSGAFDRITYEGETERFEGGKASSSRFNVGLSCYTGG